MKSSKLIYWPMSFFYFSINNTMLHHTLVVAQAIQMCTYFQKLKLVDFGPGQFFLLTIRSPTFIRTSSSGLGLKMVPIYSSDGLEIYFWIIPSFFFFWILIFLKCSHHILKRFPWGSLWVPKVCEVFLKMFPKITIGYNIRINNSLHSHWPYLGSGTT